MRKIKNKIIYTYIEEMVNKNEYRNLKGLWQLYDLKNKYILLSCSDI